MDHLTQSGVVLLRGFKTMTDAKAFAKILDALGANLMDYIGGTAPRHSVLGKISTSTDMPPEYTLVLHQVAYMANPSDRIAFFCEIPAAVAGQTPVADARRVTARLDPGMRLRFEAKGLRVRRSLPKTVAVDQRPGIPKAWPAVFETNDPSEVERIAEAKGWGMKWLPDGTLQLWQKLLPPFKTHPVTKDRVWFNQRHYHTPECTLKWAERDSRISHYTLIKDAMDSNSEWRCSPPARSWPRRGARARGRWQNTLAGETLSTNYKVSRVLRLDLSGQIREFRGRRLSETEWSRHRAASSRLPAASRDPMEIISYGIVTWALGFDQ